MTIDDALIDRFLDGDVSEAEAASVLRWLEVPVNLDRFARRAELHTDLRKTLRRRSIQSAALELHREDVVTPTFEIVDQPESPDGRLSRSPMRIGTLVCLMAACLLIVFVIRRGDQEPASSRQSLASVVSEIDAVLISDQPNWREVGLAAGAYQLTQGLLHLRFDGGVMVFVEAPARFDAVSGQRVVLHAGRLSANVPPEGVGFTVETSEAEVVDFGTEFSVDVSVGTSEVHVFNGLVRVQPRSRTGVAAGDTIDLRTAQALKIEDSTVRPVGIEIARNRFIRNFDEPQRNYSRAVKTLSPAAYYQMAIRDKGLASTPPGYSGVVLTGAGKRPPHARGVFSGGSLRVQAESTGRGGRVDSPPPLSTGRFTLSAFVYLESLMPGGTVATNIRGDDGSFALALDQSGRLLATIRDVNGNLQSAAIDDTLPLETWRHVVVTADGQRLQIFANGEPVVSTACSQVASGESTPIWFGTDGEELNLWDGRIDEVVLFDKSLSDQEVASLYQSALAEMARLK